MGPDFKNGDKVRIARSGERGVINGTATYVKDETRYQVRYTAADGRATEAWFSGGELEADEG